MIHELELVVVDIEGDGELAPCADKALAQRRAIVRDRARGNAYVWIPVSEPSGDSECVVSRPVLDHEQLELEAASTKPLVDVAHGGLQVGRFVVSRHHDRENLSRLATVA